MLYNHMYDVSFSAISHKEDQCSLTKEELVAALLNRIADILDGEDGDVGGTFGYSDSYVVDENQG